MSLHGNTAPPDGCPKGKIHCSCWMCRRKSYDDPQIRDKRAAMDAIQQLLEIE